MKYAKAKASLILMGVFAYLLLAITFYQSAWAEEECEVQQVCFIHKLANSRDEDAQLLGHVRVIASVDGYQIGFLDAMASTMADDADAWLANLGELQREYESCAIYEWKYKDVERAWLTFTANKQHLRVHVATMLFVNQVCNEQIKNITSAAKAAVSKRNTKAKGRKS